MIIKVNKCQIDSIESRVYSTRLKEKVLSISFFIGILLFIISCYSVFDIAFLSSLTDDVVGKINKRRLINHLLITGFIILFVYVLIYKGGILILLSSFNTIEINEEFWIYGILGIPIKKIQRKNIINADILINNGDICTFFISINLSNRSEIKFFLNSIFEQEIAKLMDFDDSGLDQR